MHQETLSHSLETTIPVDIVFTVQPLLVEYLDPDPAISINPDIKSLAETENLLLKADDPKSQDALRYQLYFQAEISKYANTENHYVLEQIKIVESAYHLSEFEGAMPEFYREYIKNHLNDNPIPPHL